VTTEEALKHPKLEPPLRIVLLYLLFGGFWILLSDRILSLLFSQEAQLTLYQTLKGWFFILVSGGMLYILLLTQQTRDRQAKEKTVWLASFPERNPNPIVEIDSTGAVFYMNPAAQNKFPDLPALGFKHPWLADLESMLLRFHQGGLGELGREIRVGDAWYAQPVHYLPETARLRIYGTEITERKCAERQSIQMKRLYATLSQVNQVILRVNNREDLYHSICEVAVQFGECSLAWIGILDEVSGEVHPVSGKGLDLNDWPFPIVNIHTGPYPGGLIARALHTGSVMTSENVQTDERLQSLFQHFHERGFHAAAVIPFGLRQKVIGILSLLSQEKDLFKASQELRLLEEMGQDISFALDTMQNEEERKQAEEALRASEERFRLLFENNHAIMMLIEPVSGAIRDANQAAASFYGYSLSELRAMNINDINQLSPDEVYAERMRALTEERNYFHFQHCLSNGQIRPVEVHSAPVELDGVTLLFSIIYDITERKHAEEEKLSRSRQLAALLDASQSLTESLNLAEVSQKIVDKAANVLGVESVALYLVEGEHLYLSASTPPLPAELPEMFRRTTLADHRHIAAALDTGQSIFLPDTTSAVLTAAEQMVSDALGLRSLLYVPLTNRKEAAGVLILATVSKTREFSSHEQDVTRTFSNHAALAISNARLYQDLSLHLKELEDQIAERKQAQEQFHLVVESAPNGIMLIGEDGRLRLVNVQVEHDFGYDRTELIGMYIEQLIPLRFRSQHKAHYSAFLASPHPRPMGMGRDLYGLRKDGTEFPAEIGLTSLESARERLLMVTIVDITARKRSEETLRRHINYLIGLREVDQAIASSFDVRLSLNILITRTVPLLKVDAAAILLLDPVMNSLEYAAAHGFRKNILHTGSLHLGESYAGRAVMERRMIQIPNMASELHDWFHNGFLNEENIVSYYAVPLIVKGKVVGVMEVFHRTQVTRDQEWFDFLNSLAGQAAIAIDNARLWEQVQRHARDLELRVAERTAAVNRTNAELEHANRAKDEFLANMSHELRTPLHSVLGLAELLLEQRRDPLTDYQQRTLQLIEASGQHLLELINDILDLSKIEAGKFDYFPQSVEVDALCRSSLTFIKSQAARKSITITYRNQATITNILADPRRLKQILVNLLTNAVKFTPESGQVVLQVHVDEEWDSVEFSVTDNGIGIAADDLKRLFQPFVQVDSKLNRQFEGTGLGLALVHKLTDMHGGSVYVESEVGVGSRFSIRLPSGQKRIAQQSTDRTIREPLLGHSNESKVPADVSSEGRLVLLAEDNIASILTIGDFLKTQGYRFVEAHDGLEAIEKAEAHDPSIILMDIQMPVLDGLEAMRRLRMNPRFASTPIISLTALAMPGDREQCLEAGASEYMTKPVRLKMLKQTIEKVLQG
jgi:PAS domain S-box-containing protein